MNTLNLNAYGVSEMTKEEMMTIDGGGPLKDALNKAVEWVVGVVKEVICALACPCPCKQQTPPPPAN
jgi:hypothetical protein